MRAAIYTPCSRKTRMIESTARPSALSWSMKPMIYGCGVEFPAKNVAAAFRIATSPPTGAGLGADAFLAGDGRDRFRSRPVLSPMLRHQPHGPLTQSGIDLLRHDTILSTRKDATSNQGRFESFIELANVEAATRPAHLSATDRTAAEIPMTHKAIEPIVVAERAALGDMPVR